MLIIRALLIWRVRSWLQPKKGIMNWSSSSLTTVAKWISRTKKSTIDLIKLIFSKNALYFAIDSINNSENTDVVLLLLYKSIDTETPQHKTPLVRSVEKG